MKRWLLPIKRLRACPEALEWAEQYDSLDAAWAACERGDWMLWLIGRTDRSQPYSEARKPLVRVSLACARLAWEWMPQASRDCILLHERWCAGEVVSREELQNAAAYAYADADAAYAAAAAAATAYATYAAAAAYAAAGGTAAAAAAYATYADGAAAYATYADGARMRVLQQAADIVRQHYPQPPQVKP